MTHADPVRKDFLSPSRASSLSDAPLRMLHVSRSPSSAPPPPCHPHLLVHRGCRASGSCWPLPACPSLLLPAGGCGCSSGKAESPLPAWALSHFGCVRLFATLWLFCPWDFPGKNTGVGCYVPGDLPDPGIEPVSLMSPALVGGFFTTSATWEAPLFSHYKRTEACHWQQHGWTWRVLCKVT